MYVVSTVQDVSHNQSSSDLGSGDHSLPGPSSSSPLLGSSSVSISSTPGPSLPRQSSRFSLPGPSNTSAYFSHQSSCSSLPRLSTASSLPGSFGTLSPTDRPFDSLTNLSQICQPSCSFPGLPGQSNTLSLPNHNYNLTDLNCFSSCIQMLLVWCLFLVAHPQEKKRQVLHALCNCISVC